MRKTTLKSTLRVFLLFLVTLVTGGGYALAEDGIIKFGSADGSVKISSASVTGDDNLGNTWTVKTDIADASFTQNAAYSQVGSSKKPATSITFTMSLPAAKKITNFFAKFGGFSSTAGTISLQIDGNEVGTGKLNAANDVSVESTPNISGTAFKITITGIAKGVKCYEIAYSYASGGDTQQNAATPTLTEAGEFDTAEKVVTITNNEEGATVYYTTDGNAPTTESTSFTGASKDITITATTTVKAMATVSGKNNSPVASATYTKVEPITVYENVAAFVAAKPTVKSILQLTDALVYGNKNGKNVYVSDATGTIILFGTMPEEVKYGTKVTMQVSGTHETYNGLPEVKDAEVVGTPVTSTADTPYEGQEVTIDAITDDLLGKQLVVKNVSFEASTWGKYGTKVKDASGKDITVYDMFGVLTDVALKTNVKYDVAGLLVKYNSTYELLPEAPAYITEIAGTATAEAPTLTAEGEFTGSKEVTITNNEEGGTVYYATDGSDPTTDSPSFTGESKTLTLTATTTVKAMAVAEGKEQSTVASATYTMVAATPELTFAQKALEVGFGETTIPQNALTCTSDGQVTYTSSDPTVATVAQDGTVTYVAPGLTTITATAAATDAYQEGTASYTLLLVSGDGTWEHPYSPVDAVNASCIDDKVAVWVKGVYKGMPDATGVSKTFNTTAMALYSGNDAPSTLNTVAVEIPKDVKWREAFCTEKNVEDGVIVTAYGTFNLRANGKGGYFGRSGIKSTSKISVSNSTMTIGETGYATYYDSLKVELADGIQGGVITETDGERLIIDYKYSSGKAIAAETAVLLKGAPGEYPIIYITGTATGSSTNLLRGTLTDALTTAPEEGTDYNFYMLSLNAEGQNIGFYWGTEGGAAFKNTAGHAYLAVPKSTAQNVKGFSITDLETGLSQIEASDIKSGAVYDLQGRRVNRAAHGLYIQNGHVVLVK